MAKRQSQQPTALFIADLEELLPSETDKEGKLTKSCPMPWGMFRAPGVLSTKLDNEYRRKHELYCTRRELMKSRKDGFAILGVYDEMFRHIGLAKRRAFRGWLVNSQYRSANHKEIAALIYCPDQALVKRAMQVLTEVGLLVRCRLPDLRKADFEDRQTYPAELTGKACPSDDGNDWLFAGSSQEPSEGPGDVDVEKARGATDAPRVGGGEKKPPPAGGEPPPTAEGLQPGLNRGAKGLTLDDETPDGETDDDGDGEPPKALPSSAPGNGETGERKETAQTADAAAAPRPPVDEATPDAPRGDEAPADGPRAAEDMPDGVEGETGPAESLQDAVADAVAVEPTEADAPQQAACGGMRHPPDQPVHDGIDVIVRKVMELLYPTDQSFVMYGQRKVPPRSARLFAASERGSLTVQIATVEGTVSPGDWLRFEGKAYKEARRIGKHPVTNTPGAAFNDWAKRWVLTQYKPEAWNKARKVAKATYAHVGTGPP